MRRREFIRFVGGAAVSWPREGWAQQSGKLPTIGLLVSSTPADESQRTAAFTQRLHQLGWIDGRTVAIVLRAAESRPERVNDIAAEFVRLNADIIVTCGAFVLWSFSGALSAGLGKPSPTVWRNSKEGRHHHDCKAG